MSILLKETILNRKMPLQERARGKDPLDGTIF
jgi:hypothetical protein